jgi:hypothetical protein
MSRYDFSRYDFKGSQLTFLKLYNWDNLNEQHFDGVYLFPWREKITKKNMARATSLSVPEHKLPKTIMFSKSIIITATYEYLNHPKHLNIGSLKASHLLEQKYFLLEIGLSEPIKNKLSTKNISECDLISINWKFKHEVEPTSYRCHFSESLDLKNLIKNMQISVSNKI